MSEHTDYSKGFLKDKLAGFHADPPPEVWNEIAARMKGRRRKSMFIIFMSAAASIALAITLGIHYYGQSVSPETELASENEAVREFELGPLKDPGERYKSESISKDTNKRKVLQERVVRALDATVASKSPEILSAEALWVEEDSNMENEDPQYTLLSDSQVGDEELAAEESADTIILDAGLVPDDQLMADLAENREKDQRWVLGAVLSPLYSFRDAEPDALAGTSGQESGTISYSAGFQVGYRATRRLAFESGILFNKMGISIGAPGIKLYANETDFEVARPDFGGATLIAVSNTVGNIVSLSGDVYVNNYLLNSTNDQILAEAELPPGVNAEEGIRQNLDYLEIPLNLRYTILDRDFQIQLVGGMSTNLLVNNSVTMEGVDGTTEIGYLTNIRNVNYSGNAGLGFVYHFFDQLSVAIEPRFRYYLNSVNDATLPSTRPYTFGIYTGINYFF